MADRLLVINIAGLACTSVGPHTPNLRRLADAGSGARPVQPPLPALTSPSQASLLTGQPPSVHGIVANGWYFPELAQVLNWQRSNRLVGGEPLWEAARQRKPGLKAANLFWRFAAHSSCDLNVMERPTYWADGRKSPDIYSEPQTLRDELFERLGPFPLFNFWGPFAGIASTRWIVDATIEVLNRDAMDLILTYLPHLDYDHQRFGPDCEQGHEALRLLDKEAGRLIDAAQAKGMRVAVVSDYAFEPVHTPIYLNRLLREAGLLSVHAAQNGELLEPGASEAFAVCDQQTAHIYLQRPDRIEQVRKLLEATPGVGQLLDADAMAAHGIHHARSGQLLAVAAEGHWFTYPYWLTEANAPDFARCIAIHDKPGFDPSELFLRPGLGGKLHLLKRVAQMKLGLRARFDVISGDATRVGGSHGRIPTCDAMRPLLITSWPIEAEGGMAMHEIRPHLLRTWG